MHICTTCLIQKFEADFYFNKNKGHIERSCKECVRAKARKRAFLKREQIREYAKAYREGNKDKINAYCRTKRANNPNVRIAFNLRARLSAILRGKRKPGSAIIDLGCSLNDLKAHLEAKFQPGMTWDNYGKWHIDHIKPLSSFDLTNRDQFLKACHYQNLQPLWARDNILKSDNYGR